MLISDPKRCSDKYEIVTNFTLLVNLYRSKDTIRGHFTKGHYTLAFEGQINQ